MTLLVAGLIIVGWLMCSVVAYAGTFAYYQGIGAEYPEFNKSTESETRLFCAIVAILGGPIALFTSFIIMGGYKHGFRFW